MGLDPSGDAHIHGSKTNLNTSDWFHVAAVHDGAYSEIKLFVNGQLVASGNAGPLLDSGANFQIGSWPVPEAPRYFRGKVDEVRLYNRALTLEEVQTS